MKLKTARFGEIEISQEDIIEFSEGLLGFDPFHRFVILNSSDNSPFRWLQSLDDGSLAFVIIEPLNFLFEYDLDISDADAAKLGLQKPEDVIIYVIVTIPENIRDMTANLQGPLIINALTRKGRQIISTNHAHSLKAGIVDEMARREARIREVKGSLDSEAKKGEKG